MANEAIHSSWASCLWPWQVVSSYHRLTSLMTIASHANTPASPGSLLNAQEILIFCLSAVEKHENVMQLRWNYAALFGHPEQCCLLPRKHLTVSDSPEADLAAMKDDSRSLSVIAMKWWISKDQKKRQTRGCLSKSCAQGWELSFSILSSEPLYLVLKVIFLFTLPQFLSFLGLRPTSRGPGHCSVLQHSLIFQMQWWAKPISPQRGTGAQLSISSSGTCDHT